MKRVLIFLAVIGSAGCESSPPDWRAADLALPTRWSSEVSPDHARPEYPRPAMRRDARLSLNGLWDTERYALRFTGLVRAPETGVYAFHLTSDDGSRLMVGELELDNDGIHGMETQTGWIALQAGWHPIDLEFFQGSGGVGLRLEMEGPGCPRAEIPASLLSH